MLLIMQEWNINKCMILILNFGKSQVADGMSADARMENLIKHTADDENEFSTL